MNISSHHPIKKRKVGVMLSQSGEATTNDKLQALKMIEVLKDRNWGRRRSSSTAGT